MGPFATATELSEWVQIGLPNDLSRWQAVLQSASDLMRAEKGQVLSYVVNESVILPASGTDTLYLPEEPVVSVTSVTVNGVLQGATTYTVNDVGTLKHVDGSSWPDGATVVYSHGWQETTSGFGALRTVCMRVAARALFARDLTQGGIPVETAGWPPQVFLTTDDCTDLMNLGAVPVG